MKLQSPIERLKIVFTLIKREHHIGRYVVIGVLFQISAMVGEIIKLYKPAEYQAFGSQLISTFFSWISHISFPLSFMVDLVVVVLGILLLISLSYLGFWFGAFLICIYQNTASGTHLTIPVIVRRAQSAIGRYFITVFGKGLIVFFGLILLIIPGIIFLVWFYFAETIAVVEDSSANALQESRRLVKNRFWQVIGHILFIILIQIVVSGVLLFIVSIFFKSIPLLSFFIIHLRDVLSPIVGLYLYLLYVDLKQLSPKVVSEPVKYSSVIDSRNP